MDFTWVVKGGEDRNISEVLHEHCYGWISFSYLYCTGANKDDYDGNTVDSQLKLDELGDAVVDVTAPHNGFHYTVEVVIGDDDVRRLLGDVRTGDALWSKGIDNCEKNNFKTMFNNDKGKTLKFYSV